MGFYDIINTIIGPVLDPLKAIGPFYVILLISLIVSLIITVVYKYATDQKLMKSLKDDIKVLQKDMKKLRNNPQKMMKVQKEAMDKNMKYMMHSFRATLITFIPLILIFGWLNTNFAYESLGSGDEFSAYIFLEGNDAGSVMINTPEGITLVSDAEQELISAEWEDETPFNKKQLTSRRYGGFLKKGEDMHYAGWTLTGEKGTHLIEFNVEGSEIPYTHEVLISNTDYSKTMVSIDDGTAKGTITDNSKLIVTNLLGWKLGWLGSYIIFSIIFSMVTRKLMKVY